MLHLVNQCCSALAEIEDGEAAFLEFFRSAGRALSSNEAIAPLVGLVILTVLVVLADWKFAGWLQRVWRRRHARGAAHPKPRAHAGRH